MNHCAVCNGFLFSNPILELENMPKSAQEFYELPNSRENHGEKLSIYQCSDCGLVQIINCNPVPYFKEVIRANAFSKEMGEFRLNQLSNWIQEYSLETKKILEIGCGKGEYVELLSKMGFDVHGIEHSQQSVSDCHEKGLDVIRAYLGDNLPSSLANFGAFLSFNFIEHWPNPNHCFNNLRKVLSSGAIGLLEVPNFDMMIQKNLFSEFIPDHIFYYTKDTFKFLLEKNGFEVLEIKTIWYDYIISAVVKKRTPLSFTEFDSAKNKLILDLRSFINQNKAGGIAVWGAGHQALSLLALSGVGKQEIKCVVDSAKFKQDKYTPVSDLLICSPSVINELDIENVIVMGAGYSDEIIADLKKNYINVKKIAVVRDVLLELIDVF